MKDEIKSQTKNKIKSLFRLARNLIELFLLHPSSFIPHILSLVIAILISASAVNGFYLAKDNYVRGAIDSSNILANGETTGATFAVKMSQYSRDIPNAATALTIYSATCSNITDCSAREIVKISAASCTGAPPNRICTCTITSRNQESTTHSGDWIAGSRVQLELTAGMLTEFESGGGSTVYPEAGVPNSTGSAWGTSYSTDGSGDCGSGFICLGGHTHSGYEVTSHLRTSFQGTPDDTHYPSEKLVKDSLDGKQATITYPVTGMDSPTAGYLVKWGASGNTLADALKIGTFTNGKSCSFSTANGLECTDDRYFVWRDEYSPTTSYSINNMVRYSPGGCWVISKTDANYGNTPSCAANTNYWSIGGLDGAVGPGVASGGTTGQCLAKTSDNNYETGWTTCGSGGSMPGAGIALSTGSAWGTSIANNSANWNTAYGWGNHASGGYEVTSNKRTAFQATPDDTHYPSEKLVKDSLDGKQAVGSYLTSETDPQVGTVTDTKWCVGDGSGIVQCTQEAPSGGGMIYPGAGIPLSTGSAWGTSIPTDGSGDCGSGAVCLGGHTHSSYLSSVASDSDWTVHGSYPAACTNQFVRALGDTNTCASVGIADLASVDFGSWTCNGSTCTVDNGAIGIAQLASVDFGGFTCNGSICTIDSDSAHASFLTSESDPVIKAINGFVKCNGLTCSASTIGIADLSSVDFGGFTCNGSTCTIDSDSAHSSFLTSVASDSDWTVHGSYPAACSAGQYVSQIGDTSTCSQPGDVTGNAGTVTNGVYLASSQTLTNKRITKRIQTASDATSITPTGDSADMVIQTNTQGAGTLTINAPTGTPTDGQVLVIRIKSTNVQTYSWNSIYRGATGLALPTVSSGSTLTDYIGFIYNSGATKWDIVGSVMGY